MKGHNTNITVNAHKYERMTNDYYTRDDIDALCMDAQRNDDGYYDEMLYYHSDNILDDITSYIKSLALHPSEM